MAVSIKNQRKEFKPVDPEIPFLGIFLREIVKDVDKDLFVQLLILFGKAVKRSN